MVNLITTISLGLFISLVIATPDCYNTSAQSVSKKWNGYMEPLTPEFKNFRVDWFTLKPGQNCAFYTFNDIYFASFNPNVQSIYLNFLNATDSGSKKSKCTLESTEMRNFQSGTWLYANSSRAPQGLCGYYVGVANSDTKQDLTFQIIRFQTEGLPPVTPGKIETAIFFNLSQILFITVVCLIILSLF